VSIQAEVNTTMNRMLPMALSVSSLLGALVLAAPATALAGTDTPAAADAAGHRHHHHRGASGTRQSDLLDRALALPSLSNGQRSVIESLAAEQKASRASARPAHAKVMSTLAGQVEKGAIDRAALAPSLKQEADATVASRLRARSIEERLHAALTAAQCAELGGGKDFLGPARSEADIRTMAERRESRMVDHLEKKLPTMGTEQRANMAAKLRARAGR
jgi:hypothetical protein